MTIIEKFSVKNFIRTADMCGCGFKHDYPLEIILFGSLDECLDIIEDYGVKPPYGILYDEITYKVAGKRVLERLKGQGFVVNMPTYHDADLKFKEVRKADIKTIVAVGGGTVIDVAKYVAYKGGYEFVAIPTAPSNDGIASLRSVLYHESATGELVYKGTSPANPPLTLCKIVYFSGLCFHPSVIALIISSSGIFTSSSFVGTSQTFKYSLIASTKYLLSFHQFGFLN